MGTDLFNSNGRIYDARLGRFLQADSIVPDPKMLASLNRYSYVYNNPLNATDPSGHNPAAIFFQSMIIGAFFQVAASELNMPILGAVGGIVTCAVGYCSASAIGSMSGYAFGSTFISSGGNFFEAYKSAMISAFSAGAFSSIGEQFNGCYKGYTPYGPAHILSHAMLGGVLSVMQGDKFGHGFVSAGFTKTITPWLSNLRSIPAGGKYIDQAIAAGIVGGTVSKLTGGKFANGAVTGAMGNLFNAQGYKGKWLGSTDRVNTGLLNKISVNENGIQVSTLTVELDGVDREFAENYIKLIEQEWNVDLGEGLSIAVDLELTDGRGDIVLTSCANPCVGPNGEAAAGIAQQGGRIIQVTNNQNATIPGHEFGHILGLAHSPDIGSDAHYVDYVNGGSLIPGSIMSYDSVRHVTVNDLLRVRALYE